MHWAYAKRNQVTLDSLEDYGIASGTMVNDKPGKNSCSSIIAWARWPRRSYGTTLGKAAAIFQNVRLVMESAAPAIELFGAGKRLNSKAAPSASFKGEIGLACTATARYLDGGHSRFGD